VRRSRELALELGDGYCMSEPSLSGPTTLAQERHSLMGETIVKSLRILAVAIVGVTIALGMAYRSQRRELIALATSECEVRRDATITQVERWRERQVEQVSYLVDSPSFRSDVRDFLSSADSQVPRTRMRERLDAIAQGLGYTEAEICSPQGTPLLFSSSAKQGVARRYAEEVAASDEPTLTDIHMDWVSDKPHVAAIAPIRDVTTGAVLGTLVLRTELDTEFYPILQSQIGTSGTAETLLVERHGDDVLYLNALRFDPEAALKTRLPVTTERLPGAMAVTRPSGTTLGLDYRRANVVAAYGRVPGTPWAVVSKIDEAEVLRRLNLDYGIVGGISALLLVGGSLGFAVVWERRNHRAAAAELELERSRALIEKKYDLLMQSASDAVLLADSELSIVEFNDRAREMYARSRDELQAMNLVDLQPEGEAAPTLEVRLGGMSQGDGAVLEATQVRGDGTTFEAEVAVSAIEATGRRLYLMIVRDISERKRHRRELEARNQELARSNAELERFAYVASHDLQEPLRMVASYTELLRSRYKGRLDSDADDFIDYAVEGAERMQGLISGLLMYSRAGTREQHPERIDTGDVVRETMDNLSVVISETRAIVSVGPLPVILADRTQFVRLFQNLLSNAVKFRAEGIVPQVQVEARRGDGEWVFSVADNGIGVADKYLEEVFTVFRRLESRADYDGTGIGLAICKRIVERRGGRIWVESTHGLGSTFFFTVPDQLPSVYSEGPQGVEGAS